MIQFSNLLIDDVILKNKTNKKYEEETKVLKQSLDERNRFAGQAVEQLVKEKQRNMILEKNNNFQINNKGCDGVKKMFEKFEKSKFSKEDEENIKKEIIKEKKRSDTDFDNYIDNIIPDDLKDFVKFEKLGNHYVHNSLIK